MLKFFSGCDIMSIITKFFGLIFVFAVFHIAIATINDLDYIFSLNFQHINRHKTKIMTSYININNGYKSINICSPMEVIEREEE